MPFERVRAWFGWALRVPELVAELDRRRDQAERLADMLVVDGVIPHSWEGRLAGVGHEGPDVVDLVEALVYECRGYKAERDALADLFVVPVLDFPRDELGNVIRGSRREFGTGEWELCPERPQRQVELAVDELPETFPSREEARRQIVRAALGCEPVATPPTRGDGAGMAARSSPPREAPPVNETKGERTVRTMLERLRAGGEDVAIAAELIRLPNSTRFQVLDYLFTGTDVIGFGKMTRLLDRLEAMAWGVTAPMAVAPGDVPRAGGPGATAAIAALPAAILTHEEACAARRGIEDHESEAWFDAVAAEDRAGDRLRDLIVDACPWEPATPWANGDGSPIPHRGARLGGRLYVVGVHPGIQDPHARDALMVFDERRFLSLDRPA